MRMGFNLFIFSLAVSVSLALKCCALGKRQQRQIGPTKQKKKIHLTAIEFHVAAHYHFDETGDDRLEGRASGKAIGLITPFRLLCLFDRNAIITRTGTLTKK